jgi:hypothetical protein
MENLAIIDETFKTKLDEFNKRLDQPPPNDRVKKQDGYSYVPIDYVETQLNRIFCGLWQMENTKLQVIGNAIVCTMDLVVFHPIPKVWIRRSGIGAIKIQLKKGSKPMEIENLVADAIEKNAPAAKSEALKNACKSFGNVFGANLNRHLKTTFKPTKDNLFE